MSKLWERLFSRGKKAEPKQEPLFIPPKPEIRVSLGKREFSSNTSEIEGFCILGRTYLFEKEITHQ